MATLIEARDGRGKLVGRCDERCYNGTGTQCRCICGGANHGIGLQAAAQQTRTMQKFDPDGLWEGTPAGPVNYVRSHKLSDYAAPTLF